MHRIPLVGTEYWFDRDEAKAWEEDTDIDRDGNHISLATGSQWRHQRLYRTRKGSWVVETYGNGEGERYEEVETKEAAAWLVRCNEDVPEELDAVVAELEL